MLLFVGWLRGLSVFMVVVVTGVGRVRGFILVVFRGWRRGRKVLRTLVIK